MSSRRALACAVAVAVAFAAVADNAVVCSGDAGDVRGTCAEMPCHTPALAAVTTAPSPVLVPRCTVAVPVFEPASADAPPPPTPPPTTRG